LRWRIRPSVTHGTIGLRAECETMLERPVSSVEEAFGGAFGDGCETGPDAGPKLDMRVILASAWPGRQGNSSYEIHARRWRLLESAI
jgi:hypothetical protein